MRVKQLDHLNLSVRDFDETVDWYRRVFGFELVEDGVQDDGVRWGIIRGGDALLCLYEHGDYAFADRFDLEDRKLHGVSHFALRIDGFDEQAIRAQLAAEGVEATEVGQRYGAEGIGPSLYLADPDGNTIELKGPAAEKS